MQERTLSPLSFALLAVLIGVVAGFGAVVFRALIAFFHNLLFLGKWSLSYDANIHTAVSPWGVMVVFVPVLGAIGVVFLVKNFAPEAKGHGVPEVMDAIYYSKGVIRPVVAAIKSLASALSIGSGGSVGREGPIIQIGSSFGSTVGQVLRVPIWQRITLIAAGAGSGIAATFNTPVGGLLFALEIMMHEVSVRTLVPVAIATATATYIGRLFFGPHPSFVIPTFETSYFTITQPMVLGSYVILGLLIGAVSAIYVKSIYGFEDLFEKRIKGSYYLRHMLGMLLVGVIMYLLMTNVGHYYVEGVGYATVQDVLTGSLSRCDLLLLLFVLKLLVTSLTLGSGASGGIFSPGLYLGATLGGVYGILLERLFPGFGISPPAFAVAGMAGLIGGSTGAAVTAIVMIFEMTLDYNVIIPMTITVAVSYGIRKALCTESIYTLKLARRGHHMPEALQTNFLFVERAREVMDSRLVVLSASMAVQQWTDTHPKDSVDSWLVVQDNSVLVGFIRPGTAAQMAAQSPSSVTLGELADTNFVTVYEDTVLLDVITAIRAEYATLALVVADGKDSQAGLVSGLITKDRLAEVILEGSDLFADSRSDFRARRRYFHRGT